MAKKTKKPSVIKIDEKTTSKLISLSNDIQVARLRVNDVVETYRRANGFGDEITFQLSQDGKQLIEVIDSEE